MWKGHLRSVVKMTACSSEGVRSHRGQPGSKVPLPQQLGNVSTVGEPCAPWAVVPHSACRWRCWTTVPAPVRALALLSRVAELGILMLDGAKQRDPKRPPEGTGCWHRAGRSSLTGAQES